MGFQVDAFRERITSEVSATICDYNAVTQAPVSAFIKRKSVFFSGRGSSCKFFPKEVAGA